MHRLTRTEFEAAVDGRIGKILRSYGFHLSPQPPAELADREQVAMFEAIPAVARRSAPRLLSGFDLEVEHVGLAVRWVRSDRLVLEVEGVPILTVARQRPGVQAKPGLDELLASLGRRLVTYAEKQPPPA